MVALKSGDTGVFDVKTYGARGDGTTDDGPALQVAVDAAAAWAAANGGRATVLFPPARYLNSATQVILKDNLTVVAYGAYIFSGSGTRGPGSAPSMFSTQTGSVYGGGADNIVFMGGVIDCKGQDAPAGEVGNQTGYNAFSLANCRNFSIKDVSIRNVASWHAIDASAVDGLVVDSCRFEGFVDKYSTLGRQFSEAIQLDQDNSDFTPTKNVVIQNCYMGAAADGSGLGAFGTFVGSHTQVSGQPMKNIRIIGNYVEDAIQYGIYILNWQDVTIASNVIVGAGTHGIFGAQYTTTDENARISIDSNAILGTGSRDIWLDGRNTNSGYNDCSISSNSIGGGTLSPLRIDKTTFSSMYGNVIRDGDDDGVELATDSNDNAFTHNVIIDASFGSGIQVDSSDRNMVSGNLFYNIGDNGIWIANSSIKNMVSGNHVIGAGGSASTFGCITFSNTANNDNVVTYNRCQKFGSGVEVATPILFSGTNPTGNSIVFNSFEGWSATHSSNISGTGTSTSYTMDGTATANNATA